MAYFSVDEDNDEFRGIRGKGTIKILYDTEFNQVIAEKIILKYTRNLESKLAKEIIYEIINGVEVGLEIDPKFYSTWSFTL